jgi:flagellar motor component MotA
MVEISLKELKSEYKKATDFGRKRFNLIVRGQKLEFVTAYVKYLIQSLEEAYKKQGLTQDEVVDIKQDE